MGNAPVTEPVLLAALAKQGIVAANVGLQRDYAPRSRGREYSPYARTYRDAVTGKKLAVISALPGCDTYSQDHELVWSDKNGIIESGNNIFHAVIDRVAIGLAALSDQPGGVKTGDSVAFHPQLFVDEVEVRPLSDKPRLIDDPFNENYPYNTLEWDYGVCLRRVRLIEGRFLGSWVFLTDPKGDVLIKYNQSGKLKLRLQYARDSDTEYFPKECFERVDKFPVTISDSATFYPDADPEISSVDGNVTRTIWDGETWSSIRDSTGTNASDSDAAGYVMGIISDDEANKWRTLYRSIFLFDTSGLTDNATISAATFSVRSRQYYRQDQLGINPSINIFPVNPAANTSIVSTDYGTFGTTPCCDTAITYSGWNDSGYNDFELNATGIGAISKNGVTKIGGRNANYDVANQEPAWASYGYSQLSIWFSEQGEGYQPKLVVTYTTGVTEKSASETGAGTELKSSGHPIVVVSGTETGSGGDLVGSRGMAKSETGAGLESLGSRTLGRVETGSGLEALGSRILGKMETGMGTEVASLLRAFTGSEVGSGMETALRAVALLSGDVGLGAELSWMQKAAQAGDSGAGADAFGKLLKKVDSSPDLYLSGRTGQAKMPSRQVKRPSKGVNR